MTRRRLGRFVLRRWILGLVCLGLAVGPVGARQEGILQTPEGDIECYRLRGGYTGEGRPPAGRRLGDGTLWTEGVVTEEFVGAESVAASDLDGDGDLDVLGGAFRFFGDALYWWENAASDGSVWIEHPIDDVLESVLAVASADLDGDGDFDVIAAAPETDQIWWWENVSGDGLVWSKRLIASGEGIGFVGTADLNGDGRIDLVGLVAEDTVGWWENLADDGTAFHPHTLVTGFNSTQLTIGDLDGDGDEDLAGTGFLGVIEWWENLLGDGTEWASHEVAKLNQPGPISTADMDLDGDLDLLAVDGRNDDTLSWWENLAGDGSSWAEHFVEDDFNLATSIGGADLDNDGDVDILAAADDASAVSWWENLSGDGVVWIEHTLSADLETGQAIVADLDDDGDLDVVAAGEESILWWRSVPPVRCPAGKVGAGTVISLLARPDPGWGVGSWEGTEDDDSTSRRNRATMPAADHSVAAKYSQGCFALERAHSGEGSDPAARPLSSPGCPTGRYVRGEEIELLARLDPFWQVGGWTGTEDDGAGSPHNRLSMPPADHIVSVHYEQSCLRLLPGATGDGAAPLTSPDRSEGCLAGRYHLGEVVELTASPAPGWEIGGWRGSDDDDSREPVNQVTISAAHHEVDVDYVASCYDLGREHAGAGADPEATPLGAGVLWIEHVAADDFDGAHAVSSGDVDGDGDVDLIGAADNAGRLSWFENVGGQGVEWAEHAVDEDLTGARDARGADLDGDGDLDLIAAAKHLLEVFWWENLDGNGSEWLRHTVDDDFDAAHTIVAADVDGDGDLDLVASSSDLDEIHWWENVSGDGTQWSERVVSEDFSAVFGIVVFDVDGDADLDVVGASVGAEAIHWWENSSGDGLVWVEGIIATGFGDAISVDGADIDQDGDIDVVGVGAKDDEVSWWENLAGDGSEWAEHVVSDDFPGAESVRAADIDQDGDLDLVIGSGQEVGWWENRLGDGSEWTVHLTGGEADVVSVDDVDSDGDIDILGAGDGADTILWWDNTYNGECPEPSYRGGDRLRLIAEPDPGWGVGGWEGTDDDDSLSTENQVTLPIGDHVVGVLYVEGCFKLTLAHDGMGTDPVASPESSEGCLTATYLSGEPIELVADPVPGWEVDRWIGADDDTAAGERTHLTMPVNDHLVTVIYAEMCFALSLDHTGLGADPVASPEGSPGCDSGRYLAGELIGLTASPNPEWEVGSWTGTDDDDSREPVNEVTMPVADHEVAVHYVEPCYALSLSHTGEGNDPIAAELADGSVWIRHLVAVGAGGPTSIAAGDLDGDGDPDLVSASSAADEMLWWANEIGSPGDQWLDRTVASNADGPQSVDVVDMDGNGIFDVLGTLREEDRISWWRNNDGQGTSWTQFVADRDFEGAYGVAAADVDGDGDLDLLGTAELENTLSWFENGSEPLDWSERVIDSALGGARDLVAADLDGDGDMDVAGAGYSDGAVRWFENDGGDGLAWIAHTVDDSFAGAQALAVADLDGDGDPDLLGAADVDNVVSWWENAGGDGSIWVEHVVASGFAGARSVIAADLDGDGDLDVAGAAFDSGIVSWWENRLEGSVWIERGVDDSLPGARSVIAVDLDGDGDLDLAGASQLSSEVVWWENAPSDRCPAGSYNPGVRIPLLADPVPEWGIAGWTGTEDDSSRSDENVVVMPASDHEAAVHYVEGCFALFLEHDGKGEDPQASPGRSEGCGEGTYVSGEEIILRADPASFWVVEAWQGTDNDASRSETNRLTMPVADHVVSVLYTPECYELVLGHGGDGADPLASPPASPGCERGHYHAGVSIELTAAPDPGWQVRRWRGTEDDDSLEITNRVTMPGRSHRAGVQYVVECFALTTAHTGLGADPVAILWRAADVEGGSCPAGEFHAGDLVGLAAEPAPDWGVSSWTGTNHDDRTALVNSLTMPAADHTVAAHYLEGCFDLLLDHVGPGLDPRPASPGGCGGLTYVVGTVISLRATPDPGAGVFGWSGTDHDARTTLVNTVMMPAEDWAVSVEYLGGCFELELDHVGKGGDPTASPPHSPGCPDGQFVVGDRIELTASPGPGWEVDRWLGTDDDDSSEATNFVAMPASDHRAGVLYAETCFTLDLHHTGEGDHPLAVPLGDGSALSEHIVAHDFDPGAIGVADLDGDGDTDVLAGNLVEDSISWFERIGPFGPWEEHLVESGFDDPVSVDAADLDGDGDLDLFAAASRDDELAVWMNVDGSGTVWARRTIDASYDGAQSLLAADLDGDGDLDLAASTERGLLVSWWENLGGDGELWLEHTIDDDFNGASSLAAVDLDGDGDLDLVGAADSPENSVVWWENVAGDASDWSPRVITDTFQGVRRVVVADLDGDLDADLVAAGSFDPVSWFENIAGDGSEWLEHEVVFGVGTGPYWIETGDVDGDDDLDLLISVDETATVAWWENLFGDGLEWVEHRVTESLEEPRLPRAVDLDHDGDLDLLAAGGELEILNSWENTGAVACPAGTYPEGARIGLTAIPAPGWVVGGWENTDDDTRTDLANTATMPEGGLEVTAHYVPHP